MSQDSGTWQALDVAAWIPARLAPRLASGRRLRLRAVLVDPGRSPTIRPALLGLVAVGRVTIGPVTVVSLAGRGSGAAVVGGRLVAVWAVVGAGRPAGQLGVPPLTEQPAKQGANQHGHKRADAGQGADVAPLGTGRRNSQAAQVAADDAGVGLGRGDGRDPGPR